MSDFSIEPTLVVGAVIIDDARNIFCAKRGPSMNLPNYWEFPGGKVLSGEKPEAALEREIDEEFGCKIAVKELLVDHTHDYPEIKIRLITYTAEVESGTLVPLEHSEIRWLPINKIRELKWAPADIPTIDYLVRNFARFS